MKNKIALFAIVLVVIASAILPQFVSADNNILIATSNSGSGISTGYNDWIRASNSITTTKIADYLQVESSWYNEAFDIYRAYLDFDLPTNITLVSATLTITPNGAIYNQDDIELIVVDKASWVFLGSIELASLQAKIPSTIVLDAGKITSGSIAIITSNDWYNIPPIKWNWITLNNHSDKPFLTYDYSDVPVTSVPMPTFNGSTEDIVNDSPSGFNYGAIVGGVIGLLVIIGLVIWRSAR